LNLGSVLIEGLSRLKNSLISITKERAGFTKSSWYLSRFLLNQSVLLFFDKLPKNLKTSLLKPLNTGILFFNTLSRDLLLSKSLRDYFDTGRRDFPLPGKRNE